MNLEKQIESQGNWLFKHRGILPLIILAAGIVVFIYSKLDPSNLFYGEPPFADYYTLGCIFVSLLGLSIRIYTVGYTPDNTSGRNTSKQIADTLNRTGIYSIVRHPLYIGNFLMWLGIALLVQNFWFVTVFILLYWIYYERIIYAEERFLSHKFGEVFTEWATKTPAIIPNFKLFVKPNMPFRWKKVLRQEKNGQVALFIIFSLFDFIGQLVGKNSDYNYTLYIVCLISIILYFVLRYMKNKTQLLK
ncbi:MAG: isoprenylcysteine carboxylmethyltransferase family protein [Prevotellaceae bacterium]|jgi:protein-S-isoprenylcysteine O-methyltransferase Ste14|nr:isoprenylcysteine carboxylmethyltransferase family protein [Prevotellaceae bacterium]